MEKQCCSLRISFSTTQIASLASVFGQSSSICHREPGIQGNAETRDRTGDLQIFSLTLSQLSYRGSCLRPEQEAERCCLCLFRRRQGNPDPMRRGEVGRWPRRTILAASPGGIGHAETRDRTGDLQIFGLTLSQLSYRGSCIWIVHVFPTTPHEHAPGRGKKAENAARREPRASAKRLRHFSMAPGPL